MFAALPTFGLVAGPSYAGLVFGLAAVRLVLALPAGQRPLTPDRALALLAAAFAVLCWASLLWSVDPPRSQGTALQVTAVFAGALLLLAGPPPDPALRERLFRVLTVAMLLGLALFITDALLVYPLQEYLLGRKLLIAGTKYNRGLDYLVLLAWPTLGFLVLRRAWAAALLLALGLAVALVLGLSLAAKMAALAGVAVLLLAWLWPRAIAPLLAAGMVVAVASLPFALRLLAQYRTALAPHLKESGLHRLEIWDYMTARVLDRPVLGWGIGGASKVPVTPQELSHYVILREAGYYPHDQWLQLWVETGGLGAAIGLGFALLLLARIHCLEAACRPFACAAFASATVVAAVNFELQTDSWWAALAACGYLVATLNAMTPPVPYAVLSADRA